MDRKGYGHPSRLGAGSVYSPLNEIGIHEMPRMPAQVSPMRLIAKVGHDLDAPVGLQAADQRIPVRV